MAYEQLLDRNSDFWKKYHKTLVSAVSPVFVRVFMAGARAALKAPNMKFKADTLDDPQDEENFIPVDDTTYEIDNVEFEYDPQIVPPPPPPKLIKLPPNLKQIAQRRIIDHVNEWSRSIEDSTYDVVREAVLSAREIGGGVEYVTEQIKPLFEPERVQRIAVTETTRLFGLGAQATYEAMGVTDWAWNNVNDPWVCGSPGNELSDKAIDRLAFFDSCYDLQDQTFSIETDFAPNHPNCRCWPVPVTPEDTGDDSEEEDKEFNEELHPRDDGGKFTDGAGGGVSSSNPAVRNFESAHMNDAIEHGIIVTADGKTKEVTSGQSGSIKLSVQDRRLMKDGVFSHNHPGPGYPLSNSDALVAIQQQALEARAISSDGSVSVLRAPEGGWINAKTDAISEALDVLGNGMPDHEPTTPAEARDYIRTANRNMKEFAEATGATYTYKFGSTFDYKDSR